MAMKTYTSVIDWVAAEYSRSTPKVKPYDAGTLSRVGQIVRDVHHTGSVVSEGWLGEDCVLWDALACSDGVA